MYVLDIVRSGLMGRPMLDRFTDRFILINSDTLDTIELSRSELITKMRKERMKVKGIDFWTTEVINLERITGVFGRTDNVCYLYSNTELKLAYKDDMYLQLNYELLSNSMILNGKGRINNCNGFSLPYKIDGSDEVYIELYNSGYCVEKLAVSTKAIFSKGIRGRLSREMLLNRG